MNLEPSEIDAIRYGRAHWIIIRCILIVLLLPMISSCDRRSIQEQAFDDDAMLSARKMQALLDKGLDPNTRLGPPATSEFLLWRAVKLRRTETIRLLLTRGAKPDERSSNFHKTPLFQAAYDDSREVCIMLLDHGADPNALDDSGNNPLREAILGKHPAIVRLLLERGSRPQQTNRDKLTMADLAAKYGTPEIQKLFAQ
jgi:ankyrin repeat protein